MLSEEYKDTGKLDPFDFGLGLVFGLTLFGMLIHQCFGQTTCGSPIGPINQNTIAPQCYAIPDTSDTLNLCFTFKAPGSILLFASVPPANCATYNVSAVLYDSACNVVNPSAFGILIVQPDASYVWCAQYICSGSTGYHNLFCPDYSDFSPLPVTWLYFFGRYDRIEGCVQLTWATATEINSEQFQVQYSTDADYFWTFDTKPGAGNSSTPHYYSSRDYIPGPISYYRIMQKDFDGQTTYSTTIAVIRADDNEHEIEIYDITGKRVSKNDDLIYLRSGFYIKRCDGNYSKLIVK